METEGPSLLFIIFAFIGGFSALVFIHEWGHYIVARMFGVRIESFSIGMGREVFGRTDKNGVRWKISALPLGGYVKFFGDASAASNAADGVDTMSAEDKRDCLHFKPLWQRALVVFAGPAINLIAAALIFAGFVYKDGIRYADTVLGSVSDDSPAASAGLLEGDRIISVNGELVERFNDIAMIVRLRPAQNIPFVIERSGQTETIMVELGTRYMEDRFGNRYPLGFVGVGSSRLIEVQPGVFASLAEGTRQTVAFADSMFTTLGQMIMGIRSVTELGGPARIANMVGEAAHISFQSFIWMLAILSLNLGIVNLLPIPVLDGGHLMFYGLEAIKGSPLSKRAQELSFTAGAALMLIFMVLVTLNDLQSMAL